MRQIKVAVTQMKSRGNSPQNIEAADRLVRSAAKEGAKIILLQELFEMHYIGQKMLAENIKLATALEENPAVSHFQRLAAELDVVIPVSFFEKVNRARYNSLAIIDANGSLLGIYRKSHIPDGIGYSEKFYFNVGDTGFRVWDTKYAKIGCAVCWDQWSPEAARCMALLGAELLLYPSAIGSEPSSPTIDSMLHWRTAMQGHAAVNMMPVLVSNRIGNEVCQDSKIVFYGSSFIADERGQIIEQMGRENEGYACAAFDLDNLEIARCAWGLFRDRRPDLYSALLTFDGIRPL